MTHYNGLETYGRPAKKSLRERWNATTEKAKTWAKSEGATKAINAVKNYHPRGYEETGQQQSKKKKGKHHAYSKPMGGMEFSQQYRWP